MQQQVVILMMSDAIFGGDGHEADVKGDQELSDVERMHHQIDEGIFRAWYGVTWCQGLMV